MKPNAATTELERAATLAALRAMERINSDACRRFAEKKQVTRADIVRAFDPATFAFLTNRLGLRPVRQNGKGGKLYYSTKKVLDLTEKWFHI